MADSQSARHTTLTALGALWLREMRTFIRDRARLIGAVIQPVGLWLLLGLGFQDTFRMPGALAGELSYLEFLYPGIVALILLFTAIFSTISVVEQRTAGSLQVALIAPVSRATLALGNCLGGATLATMQALLFLLLMPLLLPAASLAGFLLALATCFLVGVAFTALGFTIAWRMESTRGFHSIMMLFLMPLWFLSGACFPIAGASPLLQGIIMINPVTYAVSALRQALYWPAAAPSAAAPFGYALLICVLFTLAMVALATWTVGRSIYKGAPSQG